MEEFYMEENSRKKKYDLLGPKNDVVFQTLFSQGREKITKAMLEDILKLKIQKMMVYNPVCYFFIFHTLDYTPSIFLNLHS